MWCVGSFRRAATRAVGVSLAVAAAGVATAGTASAQVEAQPVAIQASHMGFRPPSLPHVLATVQPQSIRRSLERLDYGSLVLKETQTGPSTRRSSVGRRILGAALLGVGGFFAGGYLGAKIDGDCGGCDDPGFKGALIGAPIGAAVGAIVGAKVF
jgi:hypothetical protein